MTRHLIRGHLVDWIGHNWFSRAIQRFSYVEYVETRIANERYL